MRGCRSILRSSTFRAPHPSVSMSTWTYSQRSRRPLVAGSVVKMLPGRELAFISLYPWSSCLIGQISLLRDFWATTDSSLTLGSQRLVCQRVGLRERVDCATLPFTATSSAEGTAARSCFLRHTLEHTQKHWTVRTS